MLMGMGMGGTFSAAKADVETTIQSRTAKVLRMYEVPCVILLTVRVVQFRLANTCGHKRVRDLAHSLLLT